jgi:hypothetical protein
MFFLLPILALGFVAFATSRHSASSPPTALVQAPPQIVSAGVPSPLEVLDGYLRAGQTPPPPVILCAIAQAEAMGRFDFAHELVRTFIEPVVYAAEIANARNANANGYAPPMQAPSMQPMPAPTMPVSPGVEMPLEMTPRMAPANAGSADVPLVSKDPRSWTNDEAVVAAALEAAQRGGGIQILRTPAPQQATHAPSNASTTVVSGAFPAALAMSDRDELESPIYTDAPVRRSPIPNLPLAQWNQFVGRVAREASTFDGPRHVGKFRARKERLAELGIDPMSLAGRPDLQGTALEAEIGDAFEHARRSGMLHHYVKATITLPNGSAERISVSGVLGVIQAAGLEGAADWLESPDDRARFPHTTAAFLRCNGVF